MDGFMLHQIGIFQTENWTKIGSNFEAENTSKFHRNTNPRDYAGMVMKCTQPMLQCCLLMSTRSLQSISTAHMRPHRLLLDNSRIRQLTDCQLTDGTTRGLDISQTGQVLCVYLNIIILVVWSLLLYVHTACN